MFAAHTMSIAVGPIALDPSCSVLQYATTLFEGMKAYRDKNGKVTMFRPDMNMKRMNRSASRIALPVRDSSAFLPLMTEHLPTEFQWRCSPRADQETDSTGQTLGS